MKKIYSLVFVLLCAIGANAQRSIDLEVTLVSPTASTTVENGKSFDILAVVKNLTGPDSLKQAGDSILWFVTLDGSIMTFPVGGNNGTTWLRYNRGLMIGDTVHFNFPGRSISYSAATDQSRTLCFNALPQSNKGGNDTIGDPQINNNSGCATMTFKAGQPAGIAQTTIQEGARNVASMYPNPATTATNLSVTMHRAGQVTIRVYDVTGRTVLTQNYGQKVKGDYNLPVDLSALTPGAYIYQVQMGSNAASGNLTINK